MSEIEELQSKIKPTDIVVLLEGFGESENSGRFWKVIEVLKNGYVSVRSLVPVIKSDGPAYVVGVYPLNGMIQNHYEKKYKRSEFKGDPISK